MITGFNTNVRYRGRTFHVQTEDSGTRHPHIISHLYFGGTILASEKRDYAEHVGSENLVAEVRALMETQHKAMLKRLKAADFDAVIAERLDGAAPASGSSEASTDAVVEDVVTAPEYQDAAPEPAPPDAAAGAKDERPAASQKPLDEVILEYLVQKARDRGGRAAAARGSRSGTRSPAKE